MYTTKKSCLREIKIHTPDISPAPPIPLINLPTIICVRVLLDPAITLPRTKIHNSIRSSRLLPTRSYTINQSSLANVEDKKDKRSERTDSLPIMGWMTAVVRKYEVDIHVKEDLMSSAAPMLEAEVATIVSSVNPS